MKHAQALRDKIASYPTWTKHDLQQELRWLWMFRNFTPGPIRRRYETGGLDERAMAWDAASLHWHLNRQQIRKVVDALRLHRIRER